MSKNDKNLKRTTATIYMTAAFLLVVIDMTIIGVLKPTTFRSVILLLMNLAIFLAAFFVTSKKARSCDQRIANLSMEIQQKNEDLTRMDSELVTRLRDLEEANEAMNARMYSDELTRLKNRYAFNRDVALLLSNNSPFTIFLIDIEGFRNVNGNYGHNYGDFFLINMAKKLARVFTREKVYRWAGGHFIVVEETADESLYDEIIGKIRNTTKKEWLLNGLAFRAKLAIGVSRHPNDGNDVNDLLKKADMALNRAKESGTGNTVFFHDKFLKTVQFRYTFEKEFSEAMEKKELELVFQPIVSAETFEICGFEVLTRWERNPFSLSIGEVISMAEKTDLIIAVDRYVVEHTFAALKNEERFKDVFLSLNLSSRSFRMETLADYMREQKEIYSINPHKVHLELTEYTLIDDIDISKAIMDGLKEAGYDLSLDDFGTGYSSLNYLNKLPFHVLKVDKSYVDNVLVDKRNYIIVEDIIQLTHKLDMETIAEGVETREQIEIMKSLGCTYFQGYYFSGPLTLEELQTTPNDAFCGKKDLRE